MKKLLKITAMISLTVIFCLIAQEMLINPLHDRNRDIVLTRLQSVPQAFLVMDTEVQLAHIDFDSGSIWLGTRRGWSTIIVRIYWGMDLQDIERSDIRVIGYHAVVTLPEARVFDVVPDMGTWRYYGRRSGLQAIRDVMRSRTLQDDLINVLQARLTVYRRMKAGNRRADMVTRLNQESSGLFADTGLSVRFQ